MKRSALVLWLVAPFCLWLTLYRPAPRSAERAARVTRQVGAFVQTAEHPLTARQTDLLGTQDAAWRTYEQKGGVPVFLVAVFHEENWKSVHPPRICLEGSNMTIVEDEAEGEVGRILAKSRDTGREYVSLYVYGSADLTTASYLRFFLHHAPGALLRRSTSGFLLRVETWVEKGDRASADARCREFLGALLPVARELVRRGRRRPRGEREAQRNAATRRAPRAGSRDRPAPAPRHPPVPVSRSRQRLALPVLVPGARVRARAKGASS